MKCLQSYGNMWDYMGLYQTHKKPKVNKLLIYGGATLIESAVVKVHCVTKHIANFYMAITLLSQNEFIGALPISATTALLLNHKIIGKVSIPTYFMITLSSL